MTRDEYNKQVQEVMDVVGRIAGDDRYRVIPEYGADGKLVRTKFQVYWNGWITLGEEMGELGGEREFKWWSLEATKMVHRYVGGVSSDRVRS